MWSRRTTCTIFRPIRPNTATFITFRNTNSLIYWNLTGRRGFACSVRAAKAPHEWSGTWLFSNPSTETITKLTSQLPHLESKSSSHQSRTTFLVTPSLANVFTRPGGLHSRIINQIYANAKPEAGPESAVAIVDALPGPEHLNRVSADDEPLPLYEGIAMLLSKPDAPLTANSKIPAKPVIRFYTETDQLSDGAHELISYHVPIANTLFVNGQPSTMYSQKWTRNDSSNTWQESNIPPQNLRQLSIPIPVQPWTKAHSTPTISMLTCLEPITPPRLVLSSMGNVIRQIALDDGTAAPASFELEKLVPPLVKAKKTTIPDGQSKVFALIYPPSQTQSTAPTVSQLQTLLLSGASLHQVNSGGGGWGQKQGLLSLELGTDIDSHNDDSVPSDSGFDLEADDVQMPKLQELVPPGHLVQFFVFFQAPPKHGVLEHKGLAENSGEKVYAFGTTQGLESTDSISLPQQSEEASSVVFLQGRFGMLTTGPVAVSASQEDSAGKITRRFASLVNVPDTMFRTRVDGLDDGRT